MTESGESEVPAVRSLIRFLRSNETSENAPDATQTTERVFEAVRFRLSAVLGVGGYSTLLARTLALTRPDFPWMAKIRPDKTGSIVGIIGVITEEQTSPETVRGFVELLTRFSTLMTTFIGTDLTNRLMDAVLKDLEENTTTGVDRGGNNL